jgi:hypothetical protein
MLSKPVQKALGEEPVYVLAIEAADESHFTLLKDEPNPIVAHADAVVFAGGIESLEVGNLPKGAGGFHCLDDFPDSPKQGYVGDG